LQHPIEIAVDIAVPESEAAKTHVSEARVAFCIPYCMSVEVVLPAVAFDDEPELHAYESTMNPSRGDCLRK
jgi:hypothetical protein